VQLRAGHTSVTQQVCRKDESVIHLSLLLCSGYWGSGLSFPLAHDLFERKNQVWSLRYQLIPSLNTCWNLLCASLCARGPWPWRYTSIQVLIRAQECRGRKKKVHQRCILLNYPLCATAMLLKLQWACYTLQILKSNCDSQVWAVTWDAAFLASLEGRPFCQSMGHTLGSK
jgi:hypothetical protein